MTWESTVDLVQKAGVVVGSGTAVVGAVGWLLREKVAAWVRRQFHGELTGIKQRLNLVEDRVGKAEQSGERVAEALENAGRMFGEGVTRLTQEVRALNEAHTETRETLVYIRGRLDAERPR